MVGRARHWISWALRPPLRSKPAQLRAVRRLRRKGGFDPDLYLRRNPDLAGQGVDPVLHYVEYGASAGRNPGGLSAPEADAETAMKEDWDRRARADAMHFIASERVDWDERDFSESGRRNVEETVLADLEQIAAGRDPSTMKVLEIGCGIGRMTEHLAEVFGEVDGVDVSGEMVERGRRRLAGRRDIELHETSGADLAPFEDERFDFAYSFIVFQHVPDKEVVISNLREVHRTLKPGGTFKFQVTGAPLGDRAPDTWVGVSFDVEELDRIAREIGFEPNSSSGAGTQYLWSLWARAGG